MLLPRAPAGYCWRLAEPGVLLPPSSVEAWLEVNRGWELPHCVSGWWRHKAVLERKQVGGPIDVVATRGAKPQFGERFQRILGPDELAGSEELRAWARNPEDFLTWVEMPERGE